MLYETHCSKSYMVVQFTWWHLTLGNIERLNQDHGVSNGMYFINHESYDRSHNIYIGSQVGLSVYLMTWTLSKWFIVTFELTPTSPTISLLVNLSFEVGQILTRYDSLEARRVILSNVRTDCNNFNFDQRFMWIGTQMTRYESQHDGRVILSNVANVRTDSNLT